MDNESNFWKATVDELVKGYVFEREEDEFRCLFCDHRLERGLIYQVNGIFYEAEKAMGRHIIDAHQSTFDYLLNMDKKYTGLSDLQKELLALFKSGFSDKEIGKEMNGSSPSTIRNHRFKLKEKEKQAKVFLAIMRLLESNKSSNKEFVDFHKGAKMVDDRYAVTNDEREKILKTYFKNGNAGPLDTFPSKEKRKIIVLQNILGHFDPKKKYSEKEVSEVLKKIYHDFATLRRYLIEYGFMLRNKEGSEYWVNQ